MQPARKELASHTLVSAGLREVRRQAPAQPPIRRTQWRITLSLSSAAHILPALTSDLREDFREADHSVMSRDSDAFLLDDDRTSISQRYGGFQLFGSAE